MPDKFFGLRLGEVLVKRKWITFEQLEEALQDQEVTNQQIDEVLLGKGLVTKKEQQFLSLGEILIRSGWISWDNLVDALSAQRKSNKMIGQILVENKLLSNKDLYRGLAMQASMVFVDFKKVTIPPPVLQVVPKHVAYQFRIMPLVEQNHVLLIADSVVNNMQKQSDIEAKFKNYQVQFALACPEDISQALVQFYGPE